MKNYKRYIKRKLVPGAKRSLAFYLALILFFECGLPSVSLALTSGPSQPEVQSFEPIGTSDMVDAFSGDFSYNLPLIDVEGYPINLSYHSGISMDQEASWCGLGWNINPGVVNRNMRGIPDDFAGDAVVKDFNIKKNATIGVSTGFSGELFGLDFASFNARLGIKYNNYNGVGIEKSFNVSVSASNKAGGSGSASLGITSSSDDGLTLAPSLSLSAKVASADRASVSAGVSIGASFNSRTGLSNFTVGTSVNYSVKSVAAKYKNITLPFPTGPVDIPVQVEKAKYVGGGASTGSSIDIGGATYSPSLDMPMENLSITGNFKLGGEVFGFDGSLAVGGYYSEQRLATKTITNPAYGYMNAQFGQNLDNAMLDFNREKDGSFHLNSTYNLPVTNSTYDMYSVSGQGAGGSYRPMRSDVGHVFDAAGYSTSDGYEIGVEVGLGNLTHVGVNVTVNELNSNSNDWTSSSIASLAQSRNSAYAGYEPFYFKEANEKSVDPDQNYYDNFGGNQAARFDLDGSTKFSATTTGNLELSNSTIKPFPSNNFRNGRDRKTQVISTLSNEEVSNGFGVNNPLNTYVNANLNKVKHHIGQISSLGADGKRYIYGLPAYNTRQEEASFAVGVPEGGGNARSHSPDGLVDYVAGTDNSTGNGMGLDNYYNNITMPAFAHSYLLTAVISADYVDADNIKGPSDGDIGTYVKFNYTEKTSNSNPFKWRTPLGKNKAKYNDGLYSNDTDDKGSYVYGEKQIYFLNEIETKNYRAKFYTSDRADAQGVTDKNGEVTGSGVKQQKLDKVELISKASGSVIKTVHFQYSYELAAGSPGSLPNNLGSDPLVPVNAGGKLTLKKVYFTYQNSDKGAFNAYNFKYAGVSSTPGLNPAYDMTHFDRWGNYKASNPTALLPLDVYPYTNQKAAKATIDQWSYAWHLTKIELPSGGEINVNYETDDYAYVQNEQATQMYPINTSATNFAMGKLVVDIPAGLASKDELLPDDNIMYFRFKMEIANGKFDYVPGYVQINRSASNVSPIGAPSPTATIMLDLVQTNDNTGTPVNPIIKAAIQFGRLNNSRLIWDQPNASVSMSEQVLKALVNSSFFTTIEQTAQGPNEYLYGKSRGTNADLNQSWIKLKNTTGFKYGGGNRVKSVILNDKFGSMVSGADESEYGQVYDYTTKTASGKVISSGVASYEPQIGGEENALKHPFFTETKKLLAPDDEHYAESPFGETFYPSPGIGYSKVTIKNYVPAAQIPAGKVFKRHATGYMVHEFYTAKDFPTITDRTQLEAIQHKNDPFSLASLFHIESKDYMTVSQGFYVELNDMHGKPKADYVYAEDQASPISATEYKYKSTPYGNGSSRLENKVDVIYPDGTVKNENIGLFFDAVGDLREQTTDGQSFGLNVNVDGFLIAAIPVFIPIPIPSYTSDKTRFRSAVFTKVVQRFGILEKTTANQDGSIITTTNLAYDAETGQTLLTKVNNNYEDAIYSFKYPAYWHYGGMSMAYKNIDFALGNVTFNGSGVASISGSNNKFQEGDELEMKLGSTYFVGWVTNVTATSIEVQRKDGSLVNGTFDYIKIIRSGARNLLSVDMANVSTFVNPLSGIKTNIYDKIISASAVEFGNRWRTKCECNTSSSGAPIITNAFVNGTKGAWRPVRNYTHLTGRSQSDYDNNTNTRIDGVFTSYTPFYKLNTNGKWGMDQQNWTYASEITEFNPFGQELENVDALGRYSAATFGFNQTMATSVGANSQYKELGFDSFEDYNLSSCADRHFRFGTSTDNTTSHTGRNSIKVLANNTLSLEKQIGEQCDKEKTCPGIIKYVSFSHGIYSYTVQNGTGPYNIDAQVVSGTGNVQPTATGFNVIPTGNNYTVKITIIDEDGCTYTKLIQYPYNN